MEDFNATTAQLTFQPDTNTQCTEVPILNDLALEENEVFTVHLSTNETNIIALGVDNASVTIIDEDSKLSIGEEV